MKKVLSVALLIATNTFGQWTYKTIDNKFDEPFKKAISEDKRGNFIMLEQDENAPFLAIKGSYFCEESLFVELSFQINGTKKLFAFDVDVSDDKRCLYFSEYIWDEEFTSAFKSANKLLVRVNQEYCTDDYFEFNFSGSTAAYNFINKL